MCGCHVRAFSQRDVRVPVCLGPCMRRDPKGQALDRAGWQRAKPRAGCPVHCKTCFFLKTRRGVQATAVPPVPTPGQHAGGQAVSLGKRDLLLLSCTPRPGSPNLSERPAGSSRSPPNPKAWLPGHSHTPRPPVRKLFLRLSHNPLPNEPPVSEVSCRCHLLCHGGLSPLAEGNAVAVFSRCLRSRGNGVPDEVGGDSARPRHAPVLLDPLLIATVTAEDRPVLAWELVWEKQN